MITFLITKCLPLILVPAASVVGNMLSLMLKPPFEKTKQELKAKIADEKITNYVRSVIKDDITQVFISDKEIASSCIDGNSIPHIIICSEIAEGILTLTPTFTDCNIGNMIILQRNQNNFEKKFLKKFLMDESIQYERSIYRLEYLMKEEIDGILLHEHAHNKGYNVYIAKCMIIDVILLSLLQVGFYSIDNMKRCRWLVGMGACMSSWYFLHCISHLVLSKHEEYRADRVAFQSSYKRCYGMAFSMFKQAKMEQMLDQNFMRRIFCSHPSAKSRLKRIYEHIKIISE